MGPRSVRYKNSEQLVRLKLMRASPDFLDFVRNSGGGQGVPRVTRFNAGGIGG